MHNIFVEFPFIEPIDVKYSPESVRLAGEWIVSMLKRRDVQLPKDKEVRAAVFACTRILLSLLNEYWVNREIAENQAEKFVKMIKKMKDDEIISLSKKMGLKIENNSINVADFIKNAPDEINLTNARLKDGRVFLNRYELIMLLAEIVKKKFLDIPKVNKNRVPALFIDELKEIKKRMPKITTKIKIKKGYAPCISALIERMGNEKLPHTARWILAVYLVDVGFNDEEIIKIFSRSSDFKRNIVEYQLKHIRNVGYKVPKCTSIDSYGFCIPTCPLKKKGSPLTYLRMMQSRDQSHRQHAGR